MEEYKKLSKYLERFCKKTGLNYTLNLHPDPKAKDNKAFEEIKEYLRKLQEEKESETFKTVKEL